MNSCYNNEYIECIDNLYGCLKENMSKKEETENP